MDRMHLSKKGRIKAYLVVMCLFIAVLTLSGFTASKVHGKNTGAALCKDLSPENIIINKPLTKFAIGEEATYKVAWLGITVGTCVARVKGMDIVNGRQAYVVELSAKTNDFLSKIYPVNDVLTSYIDKERFVSLKYVVRNREGGYKKDAVTIFDYSANKAYFHNTLDGSKKTFDIPGYVQDSLSAVYYFRTLNLKVGQQVEYKVVTNEQVYDICGLVARTAYLRIHRKKYETFYIEPYAKLKGGRVEKGRLSCYFTSDSKRVPIYGVVMAPLFTKVTAVLVNKKGGING